MEAESTLGLLTASKEGKGRAEGGPKYYIRAPKLSWIQ